MLVTVNHGGAQFLPNLAGAVVWHTRYKSFKKSPEEPTVDNHRTLFLATASGILFEFSLTSIDSTCGAARAPRVRVWGITLRSVLAIAIVARGPSHGAKVNIVGWPLDA